MARYPVTAIELHVSGVDTEKLRSLLGPEAAQQNLDIAVQPANLMRRGMRLVVMDVDMSSGHGGASGRFDRLKQTARALAFFLHVDARPDARQD